MAIEYFNFLNFLLNKIKLWACSLVWWVASHWHHRRYGTLSEPQGKWIGSGLPVDVDASLVAIVRVVLGLFVGVPCLIESELEVRCKVFWRRIGQLRVYIHLECIQWFWSVATKANILLVLPSSNFILLFKSAGRVFKIIRFWMDFRIAFFATQISTQWSPILQGELTRTKYLIRNTGWRHHRDNSAEDRDQLSFEDGILPSTWSALFLDLLTGPRAPSQQRFYHCQRQWCDVVLLVLSSCRTCPWIEHGEILWTARFQ